MSKGQVLNYTEIKSHKKNITLKEVLPDRGVGSLLVHVILVVVYSSGAARFENW